MTENQKFKSGDIVAILDVRPYDISVLKNIDRYMFIEYTNSGMCKIVDHKFKISEIHASNVEFFEVVKNQARYQDVDKLIKGAINFASEHADSELSKIARLNLDEKSFRKEFLTLKIGLPRMSGTTTSILKIAGIQDLVIIPSGCNPDLYETTATVINASRFYSTSDQFDGITFNRVFVDAVYGGLTEKVFDLRSKLYVFLQG